MGWESGTVVVGVAACQRSRLPSAHLDKSFVSAEGRNVRLCCGFEVQINVRHGSTGRGGFQGPWNVNYADFSNLSPSDLCGWDRSEELIWGQGRASGFWRPWSPWFRVRFSCLRWGTAGSLRDVITANRCTSPRFLPHSTQCHLMFTCVRTALLIVRLGLCKTGQQKVVAAVEQICGISSCWMQQM